MCQPLDSVLAIGKRVSSFYRLWSSRSRRSRNHVFWELITYLDTYLDTYLETYLDTYLLGSIFERRRCVKIETEAAAALVRAAVERRSPSDSHPFQFTWSRLNIVNKEGEEEGDPRPIRILVHSFSSVIVHSFEFVLKLSIKID